jgi:hypothetical protein
MPQAPYMCKGLFYKEESVLSFAPLDNQRFTAIPAFSVDALDFDRDQIVTPSDSRLPSLDVGPDAHTACSF